MVDIIEECSIIDDDDEKKREEYGRNNTIATVSILILNLIFFGTNQPFFSTVLLQNFFLQPMEVYVDETKLTLHGLQQYYVKLKDSEKNRKLFQILDDLEFNQVCFQKKFSIIVFMPKLRVTCVSVNQSFMSAKVFGN